MRTAILPRAVNYLKENNIYHLNRYIKIYYYWNKKVQNTRENLSQTFELVKKITLGGDLWSSNASDSFLCSTFHHIGNDFIMRVNTSALEHIIGKKPAFRLNTIIAAILNDWKMSDKLFATVTDSGSNMFGAMKMFPAKVIKLPCAAHRMNSVMKDVFQETKIKVKKNNDQILYYAKVYHPDSEEYKDTEIDLDEVQELTELNHAIEETNETLQQCRHLVGSFNHNGELKRELRVQQEQLNYECCRQLSQESDTRFSDVYNMINSICINQEALQNMASNTLINAAIIDYVPSEDDFDYLNQLANLLHPLQDFIRIISASKYPTISHMYPLVYSIMNNTLANTEVDFTFLIKMRAKLVKSMEWRFDYVLKLPIFQACTFLDFRYKRLSFLVANKRSEFKKKAKAYILELYKDHFNPSTTVSRERNLA